MSNAFSLADEFEGEFPNRNQIFITSHSPAFYSLKSSRTSHYIVRKSVITSTNGENWISSVNDLESAKLADVELGVAQLVADRSQELHLQLKRLTDKNSELAHYDKPVVLTEGKADVIILKAAWEKLYHGAEIPFEIKSCDLGSDLIGHENAGADELKKILEATTKEQKPFRIGLFDRDEKGVQCFSSLKKHSTFRGNGDVKLNANKCSAAIVLPAVDWGSPYDVYIKNSMCLEMMFSFDLFDTQDVNFHFSMGSKQLDRSKAEMLIEQFGQSPDLFEEVPFRAVPKFPNKVALAQKFARLDGSKFVEFEIIFKNILALITEFSESPAVSSQILHE